MSIQKLGNRRNGKEKIFLLAHVDVVASSRGLWARDPAVVVAGFVRRGDLRRPPDLEKTNPLHSRLFPAPPLSRIPRLLLLLAALRRADWTSAQAQAQRHAGPAQDTAPCGAESTVCVGGSVRGESIVSGSRTRRSQPRRTSRTARDADAARSVRHRPLPLLGPGLFCAPPINPLVPFYSAPSIPFLHSLPSIGLDLNQSCLHHRLPLQCYCGSGYPTLRNVGGQSTSCYNRRMSILRPDECAVKPFKF